MKRVLAAAVVVIISVGLARGESSLSALGYGLFNQSAGARAAGMGLVSLSVRDTLGLNLMAPALWSGPSSVRFGFSGNVDPDGCGVGSDLADCSTVFVSRTVTFGRRIVGTVAAESENGQRCNE